MNNGKLDEMFDYCKSLGYSKSKSQFINEFKQFLVEELNSEQLEDISGGSMKNKFCASALSALSVLGVASSTNAANFEASPSSKSSKANNFKSSSPSWFSKHREAIITGVVSVVSSLGIASPAIYSSAKPIIKKHQIGNYIEKCMNYVLTDIYLKNVEYKEETWQSYQEYEKDETKQKKFEKIVQKSLEDKSGEQPLNIIEEYLKPRIMKIDEKIKALVALENIKLKDVSYAYFIDITLSKFNSEELFKFGEKAISLYRGDEYLLNAMIAFCPNYKPKMLVPKDESCSDFKLIDFSMDFFNPEYDGPHKQELEWLDKFGRGTTVKKDEDVYFYTYQDILKEKAGLQKTNKIDTGS